MDINPNIKSLYENLVVELRKLGNITVEEKKTSIHIKNRTGFAGVHPRKNYFILNIVLDSPIQSPRVVKQEQVSKCRFHNEIKIEKLEDINKELLGWLKTAYELMK